MKLRSIILFCTFSALFLGSCDNPDPEREARLAAKKKASQNRCERDSDCKRTGCRGTLCRAAPDEETCVHRLIFDVDGASPDQALEEALLTELKLHIQKRLGRYEKESLQIAQQGAVVLASFSAPLGTREELIASLSHSRIGGLYPLAKDIEERSTQLLDVIHQNGHHEIKLAAEGLALRRPIHGGDVLSKEDLLQARQDFADILGVVDPQQTWVFKSRLELNPPQLEAWAVDLGKGVDFRHLKILEESDKGMVCQFEEAVRPEVKGLSSANIGRYLIIALGQEALATPQVIDTFDGSLVEVNFGPDSSASALELRALTGSSELSRRVHFNPSATAQAESDLLCLTHEPPLANCICVEGLCQLEQSEALRDCFDEGVEAD